MAAIVTSKTIPIAVVRMAKLPFPWRRTTSEILSISTEAPTTTKSLTHCVAPVCLPCLICFISLILRTESASIEASPFPAAFLWHSFRGIRDRAFDFELQFARTLKISCSDSPSFVRWRCKGDRASINSCPEITVAVGTFKSHGRRNIILGSIENESHGAKRECCHSLISEPGMELQDLFKPSNRSFKISHSQMYM